jgi:glycyl-tRNA synthetase
MPDKPLPQIRGKIEFRQIHAPFCVKFSRVLRESHAVWERGVAAWFRQGEAADPAMRDGDACPTKIANHATTGCGAALTPPQASQTLPASMAEPKENRIAPASGAGLMEKIVSLCKRRGFIYQSSEIYGGINGFWDYGPLGAELKRNVKELWWNAMTRRRDDVVGLEATIIMHPQIWKASGHVDTFADLMVEDPITNRRFRADQIDPQSGTIYRFKGAIRNSVISTMVKLKKENPNLPVPIWLEEAFRREKESDKFKTELTEQLLECEAEEFFKAGIRLSEAQARELGSLEPFSVLVPDGKPPESARKTAKQYYTKRGVDSPDLVGPVVREHVEASTKYSPETGAELTEPRPFNLMFKTYVGPIENEDNIAYLRPETAQAIFAQFKNVLETSRQKVPFGIAQVGKAFRNEVTPRNFTFRSREFEQMELEFFIKPDEVVEAISGKVAGAAEAFGVPPSGGPEPAKAGTPNPEPNWGWEAWLKYWVEERIKFYEAVGLPRESLVEYWQKPEELAHYARATIDILYKFPFSKRDAQGELTGEELEGVAARSDFDLSQHERFSGKPMGVFDEELRAAWSRPDGIDEAKKKELWQRYHDARLKYLMQMGVEQAKAEKEAREDADGLAKGQYIPHVIEPSAGVDRLILALICNAYHEDRMPDEKGRLETRVLLKFHPRVAPIKVAVLPLLKNKPELVKKAQEVRDLLRPHMNVFYDDAGAIGRRYRRQDEAGTPFCVTIDFDTLGEKTELKDTVTMRYRDDGRQERIAIGELLNWLLPKIR